MRFIGEKHLPRYKKCDNIYNALNVPLTILVKNVIKMEVKQMSNIIDAINQENVKKDIPAFNVGDTVKVMIKVVEGDKERLQAYEGVVIARKNGGISETFTVRRMSFGVGVEKTFPIHSPKVADIQVVRRGKVRRAKLYYLRDRVGKSSKVKELI